MLRKTNSSASHDIARVRTALAAQQLAWRLAVCDAVPADITACLKSHEFAAAQAAIPAALSEPFTPGGRAAETAARTSITPTPDCGGQADERQREAGFALHHGNAKESRTGGLSSPATGVRLQARRLLRFGLRRALERGEFELRYQPQICLSNGAVCGLEALLRWRHPERGFIPPAEFIPVAEDSGLIVPIGDWVLRTACREAAGWPAAVALAVNLSPVQLRGTDLTLTVADALSAAGLPPSRLELEITETYPLQDGETTRSTLHRLRILGTWVALDDFGTGYSSLSRLRNFPCDRIKIDRSFIADLADSGRSRAILRAILDLGRSLGISVLAEGVETQQQLELLRAEGCGQVQGFLFGRPVAASEVPATLGRFPSREDATPSIEMLGTRRIGPG